ncbi:hypothetical protein QTG54_004885 [Skeletonema marinoi]|uniref:G-protein coupled receptors family 1 profile domain-containing protein n=1 Tax=Skeletonema marinoi TaxID=267567 RepID=A0AAD8YF89_9STRA|nr:hypothetical protein QTG54_004885 [Skeletonema marinoi]
MAMNYAEENIYVLIFMRLFGLVSMIASGFIIRDITRKLYSRPGAFLKKVSLTQSILIVMSIGDFGGAFFVQFISTWMVPFHSQLLGSVGSQQSCVAQGFLSTFFYSLSALSNASLAVAYCLIVRLGWKDKDKSKNRLPFVLTPFLISIVLAVVLCLDRTTITMLDTLVILGSSLSGNLHTWCTARTMLLVAGLIPTLVAFFILTVAVVLLIHAVLVQERRMDQYQRAGSRKMTMESFYQGMFYIGAFAISWIPWLVYGFKEYIFASVHKPSYFVMLAVTPLHGVMNAGVYFRPRLKAERERNPTDSHQTEDDAEKGTRRKSKRMRLLATLKQQQSIWKQHKMQRLDPKRKL